MNLEELERSLPNGLHDAELLGFQADFLTRQAILEVNIDIGGIEPTDDPPEGTCRRASLAFSGLHCFIVDTPDGDSQGRMEQSMMSSGMGQPRTAPIQMPSVPHDCFLCWIFVSRWNSFIRIAARSVDIEWKD